MKPKTLQPGFFFEDSLIGELGDQARLLLIGLELAADDHGVVIDDAVELNKELFPGQPPRPISETIDLLSAIGISMRMVAPNGDRVLVLFDYETRHPLSKSTKGRWGNPSSFMLVPAPTTADRNAVQDRFGIAPNALPVDVACEHCGVNGSLRYVPPVLGYDDFWGGAVVANRLEIVPSTANGRDAVVLCRGCRTDVTYVVPAEPTGADVIEMAGRRDQQTSDDVRRVFEAWVASTGRTNKTQLDDRRRRVITRALADYPLDDVLDAVVGWKNIPFNAGENDRGQVYDDLALLLRDAGHIEKFRDAARSGPAKRGGRRAGANVTRFDGEAAVDDFS